MANIFQRLFYTTYECRILDFIRDNSKSVTYNKTPIKVMFGIPDGFEHQVSISTPDKELSAKLVKKNTIVESVSYSFACKKSGCNKPCMFNISGRNTNFTAKVYDKMLNYYVAQHGLPDAQR